MLILGLSTQAKGQDGEKRNPPDDEIDGETGGNLLCHCAPFETSLLASSSKLLIGAKQLSFKAPISALKADSDFRPVPPKIIRL
ncbi:hypothetical protein Rhsp01_53830 [Rhizobium sp. NBRC 114257]|uniref:Uncharacterized protein n=1 Tax=Rhizobium dioscoreae TaxID=2653122 RepID=A0ABQ0Z8T9_9HYPH|nr:hypothetical protein RsS93_45750 [Rhizobium dioscoreae]GLU84207.1 hypothetical protein Rhsp01_53830 [Rhizobium sp. NBRC 114257]